MQEQSIRTLTPVGPAEFADQDGRRWVTQGEAARRMGVTVQGISRAFHDGRLDRQSYFGRFYVSVAALAVYEPVMRQSPGPRKKRRRRSR